MVRRVALAAAFAAATLACSEPPTKERQQADGAVAAARAAEAATYASAELTAAETALTHYDAAVAQRDYRQALRLAIDARESAYEAAKRAGDEKAAARRRSEQLAATLNTWVESANARLAGPTGSRPTGKAADDLRAAVKTADVALQEARSQTGVTNYRALVSTLEPVVDALRKDFERLLAEPARRGR